MTDALCRAWPKPLAAALLLAVMLAAGPAQAWEAARPTLNDTGQVRCLDASGRETDLCAGSGQDADSGRDLRSPQRRNGHAGFAFYRVCHSGEWAGQGRCPREPALGPGPDEWGCTADRVTQLMWEIKTNDGGPRDLSRQFSNRGDGRAGDSSAYAAEVNASGLCGHADWRVPSRLELQSLVDYSVEAGPKIDARWFPLTPAWFFWTSTGYVYNPPSAWVVLFDLGRVHAVDRGVTFPVRLVRGRAWTARPLPQRWALQAGEVRDRATGLVWRRCLEGTRWTGSQCTGTPLEASRTLAIAHAQAQAADTGQAWRLPNVKELASLVDTGRMFPAIDPLVFPDTPALPLWTSTHVTGLAENAWQVEFSVGTVTNEIRGSHQRFRLVRDGP
jgi:Protein of unknown function (DUF1566)